MKTLAKYVHAYEPKMVVLQNNYRFYGSYDKNDVLIVALDVRN